MEAIIESLRSCTDHPDLCEDIEDLIEELVGGTTIPQSAFRSIAELMPEIPQPISIVLSPLNTINLKYENYTIVVGGGNTVDFFHYKSGEYLTIDRDDIQSTIEQV